MTKSHKVYLVGAGPGDPGLITVKGAEALKRAEVVIYDCLANDCLLDLAPAGAEKISMGKHAGCHESTQDEINQALVDHWKRGKIVVRLKGGDPFVFGRGGEEALVLQENGIPFEVIPGVTAGLAGLSYAGIPPTHRGLAVTATLVTGHEDPTKGVSSLNLKALAENDGTLVMYMAVKNLPFIAEGLIAGGRSPDTPAAMVYKATLPEQRVVTSTLEHIVEDAKKAGIRPPSLFAVGPVVGLRENLNWFETLPLFGKKIVVTRPREQSSAQRQALEALGAEVLVSPAIAIEPPADFAPLDRSIQEIDRFHSLIFTSRNGVKYFMERLTVLGLDSRQLAGRLICAVGSGTAAALERHGLKADLIPEKQTGASLAAALIEQAPEAKGKTVLLPRADIAPDMILKALQAGGITPEPVTAYCTRPLQEGEEVLREALESDSMQAVTFASSSAAKQFVEAVGKDRLAGLQPRPALISIGPATTATLTELGFPPDQEAVQHTVPGLVEAVVDCLKN